MTGIRGWWAVCWLSQMAWAQDTGGFYIGPPSINRSVSRYLGSPHFGWVNVQIKKRTIEVQQFVNIW